ncbi:hypothetical protein AWM68_01175 [Fictibacillus phosphorivorans]|uniref:Uncharacterized protein n=1 Tax=Fictibacillus phosphorivorans TaxID=1221500 RepID=A0A165P418_9BACL|nr:hypothetical protein AWM68_01175 [Fictibacillus phosphorivorans]
MNKIANHSYVLFFFISSLKEVYETKERLGDDKVTLKRKRKRKAYGEYYSWLDFLCDVLLFIPEILVGLIRLLGRGIFRLFDGI